MRKKARSFRTASHKQSQPITNRRHVSAVIPQRQKLSSNTVSRCGMCCASWIAWLPCEDPLHPLPWEPLLCLRRQIHVSAVPSRPMQYPSRFGPSCLAGSCEALGEDIAAAQRPTRDLQCPPGSDTERWSADESRERDRAKICQASGKGLDGQLLVTAHGYAASAQPRPRRSNLQSRI